MEKIIGFAKKHQNFLLLILILFLALFFRSYHIVDRWNFDQDSDLFSWMVRDIVVNHHLRLIGQLTSAPGIFIGPLFYYLLVPFFLLFNMDPVGAVIPIIIIGIFSVFSYYWVFSKLFNRNIGLIGAFLQAVLLSPVNFDRRIVPSTPTNLWMVWYFYTVIEIARGNYSVLWVLGLLIAAIWHIHIALLPALLAVPVAVIVSKKLPNLKQVFYFFIVLFMGSIPLILFEAKHGFIQTHSLIANFTSNHGGGVGLDKFEYVWQKISLNISNLFFYPQGVPIIDYHWFSALVLLSALFLVRKKLISLKEVLVLYSWVAGVVIFFSLSSVITSEYYFTNIEVVFTFIASALAYLLYSASFGNRPFFKGKYILLLILVILLGKNLFFFLTEYTYHKGYNEKKAVAAYIKNDAEKRGFPCVAVSYITAPGENAGFRYFFWMEGLHVNDPISGSPVYSIVIPDELAGPESVRYGHIGVILPDKVPSKAEMDKSCSGEDSNLTDPMFGYTD